MTWGHIIISKSGTQTNSSWAKAEKNDKKRSKRRCWQVLLNPTFCPWSHYAVVVDKFYSL